MKILSSLIITGFLSGAATYVCYLASGPTLGMFLGGFFMATVLAPAAVLTQNMLRYRIAGLLCTSTGIAAVWLVAVFTTPDTFTEWLQLSIALICYAGAIGAIALALTQIKFSPPIAAAFAIFLGLAWLTWPIWLSATLTTAGADRLTGLLVSVHPPLVANGVLLNESPWSERTLAYQLTNLNQDIPVRLPGSALACIIIHGIAAVILFAITRKTKITGENDVPGNASLV